MKKNLLNKRIPSLLGMLFLVLMVGLVSWFGKNYTQILSKASAGETPKNVQISNITDTSFTVSFVTDDKVMAAIAFGDASSSGQVVFDDRDKTTNTPTAYQAHVISLTNLNPVTKYYFAIQSGSTTFTNNNLPYEVTTAASNLITPSNQPPITGTINLPDGSIPLEALAYVSTDDSQILSVLVKADGSYSLPLSSMLTKDLTANVSLNPDTVLHMTIVNSNSQSQVSLLASRTSAVPLVTLSRNYDFTLNTTLPLENPAASGSGTASPSGALSPQASQSAFPSFDTDVATGPAILVPQNEEKFVDQQPTFEGTALPNESVDITIASTMDIKTNIQADSSGNWEYRPDTPLDPGEHTITIISKDAQGIMQTIQRSFTVYAEGSQFNEPSVSPVELPSPTASVSASPTPTQIPPTPTPTIAVTPTSAQPPTPNLTQIYSLTQAALLSTTPDPASLTATARAEKNNGSNLPPSGNYTMAIAGIITALSIAGGFVLFFF